MFEVHVLLSFHKRSSYGVLSWTTSYNSSRLFNLRFTIEQLVCRALEGVEDEDVVDEDAVGDEDDEEATDEEEPKVTNPDLGLCMLGQKWLGFLVHFVVWILFLRYHKTQKNCLVFPFQSDDCFHLS